jgi:hypothetical protein
MPGVVGLRGGMMRLCETDAKTEVQLYRAKYMGKLPGS